MLKQTQTISVIQHKVTNVLYKCITTNGKITIIKPNYKTKNISQHKLTNMYTVIESQVQQHVPLSAETNLQTF